MAKLYLVPTPVGNLADMTYRAVSVLQSVDLILAEDTRTSGILLKHFEIKNAMVSHHKFNEHKTVEGIVNRLKAGETIALISDAGTPGISDPGFLVVRECVRNGIEVQCLPGATAFVPALVSSGLPNDRFCFEGFLPQKKGRMTRLLSLQEETRTMIFYESPYRLVKTLTQFVEYFGAERQVSVCREISKIHEECVRGTLSEVTEHFKKHEPKGEIVILLAGCHNKENIIEEAIQEQAEEGDNIGSYISILVQINRVVDNKTTVQVYPKGEEVGYAWMAAPVAFNWTAGYKYVITLDLGKGGPLGAAGENKHGGQQTKRDRDDEHRDPVVDQEPNDQADGDDAKEGTNHPPDNAGIVAPGHLEDIGDLFHAAGLLVLLFRLRLAGEEAAAGALGCVGISAVGHNASILRDDGPALSPCDTGTRPAVEDG